MERAPIFETMERRRKAADILRRVLGPLGIAGNVVETELHIQSKVIVEHTCSRKLSNAILEAMFPKQQAPIVAFHYTSIDGLRGIASSGELRLYAVRKRVGEGELKTFAKRHRLDGYLNTNNGQEYYKELSDDLFYSSFVREVDVDPAEMWKLFGEHGKGVRLQMRLEPEHAELRPIQYEQPSRTILSELNDALTAEGLPPFLPWTISRIGAFYLPSSLAPESEVRLMIKRYESGKSPARSDGRYEYWPVLINQANSLCKIELVEIAVGPAGHINEVRSALKGTAFENVGVVQGG